MAFRYVLSGELTDQPSVYKLFFGKKFYIWKGCKSLKQSVDTICRDVERFHAKGCPPGHMLQKVIDHVTRARVLFCRVEVLKQTDNLSELIEFEDLTLKKSFEDPLCLNIIFEAYVPKWISGIDQEEKKAQTQNKAISGTFSLPVIPIYHPVPENKASQPTIKRQGQSSLMDAMAKLKTKA